MATTTSFVTCGLTSFHKLSCQRFDPHSSSKSMVADRCFSPANRRFLSSGKHANRSKMMVVYSGDQVGDLLPFGITLPDNWPAWIPGVLLAVVVPFFTNKWGPFAKFKADLDKVEEAVDSVADRVEEIAEKMEDFVGDIADDLPEGSSIRQNLEKVEKVVDKIGKDAKMVSDLVDKMDEMEAKVESILDKATEKKKTTPAKIDPQ